MNNSISQNVMVWTLEFLHDHMDMEFVIEDGKITKVITRDGGE